MSGLRDPGDDQNIPEPCPARLELEAIKAANSEEEIMGVVARAAEGDPRAFDQLYDLFGRYTQNAAYKVLLNQDDAQDANQDTWLSVSQNITKFEQRSKFSTWIYRIAYNKAIDIHNKKARVTRKHNRFSEWREQQIHRDTLEIQLAVEHIESAFESVLERADPKHAMAFRHKYQDDMTLKAIADKLSVSTATIWNWISAIREEIRIEYRSGTH